MGRLSTRGEKALIHILSDALVILRLPLLTGNSPQGRRSFHEKILNHLATHETPVSLSQHTLCQPTGAENVADVIMELVERSGLTGTFHWAGSSVLSPYQMGQAFLERYDIDRAMIVPLKEDVPLDLTMSMNALGSLSVSPTSYRMQLETFVVPEHLRDACVRLGATIPSVPQRLIKGKDF